MGSPLPTFYDISCNINTFICSLPPLRPPARTPLLLLSLGAIIPRSFGCDLAIHSSALPHHLRQKNLSSKLHLDVVRKMKYFMVATVTWTG